MLYVGISDVPAWVVSQANTIAQVHGWTPFTGLQVEYSLAQRDVERELIPMARSFDVAVTAWAPLAGGVLTGKYSKVGQAASDTARHNAQNPPDEKKLHIAEAVGQIAREIARPVSQVALN